MSQANPTIGADKTGLAYRQEDNDGKKALLTHHKGASAPGYAEAGMIWIDDSASPWKMKLHDGADWITLGSINPATNAFLPYHGTAAFKHVNYAADTGTANAAVIAPVPAVGAYSAGLTVMLIPAATTTGAATIAVSGLDTEDIKLSDGSDTIAGSMRAGGIYVLVYDGTNFILTNPEVDTTPAAGSVIGSAYGTYDANEDLDAVIPLDDTIPQATEGTEILSVTHTPASSANKLRVHFSGFGATSESSVALVAFLTIDGAPAAQTTVATGVSGALLPLTFSCEYSPGDTDSHTYAIHVGPGTAGAVRLNGTMSGRLFGGTAAAQLIIEEIQG
jgi:hypothetical protein